jgi:thymidylate kinase
VTNLIVTLCHDGVGISESALVSRSLVISAREFLQLWKIWPRVKDSLFFVLDRESTLHMWRREAVAEGKKSHVVVDRTEVSSYRISVHVRGLQWEQSCMYRGFSGTVVYVQVSVETVVHPYRFFWAVW